MKYTHPYDPRRAVELQNIHKDSLKEGREKKWIEQDKATFAESLDTHISTLRLNGFPDCSLYRWGEDEYAGIDLDAGPNGAQLLVFITEDDHFLVEQGAQAVLNTGKNDIGADIFHLVDPSPRKIAPDPNKPTEITTLDGGKWHMFNFDSITSDDSAQRLSQLAHDLDRRTEDIIKSNM